MATGIAPPKEHLELGDRVRFHHRACVARVRAKWEKEGSRLLSLPNPPPPRWEVIRVEGGEPPREGDENFGLGESFVAHMRVTSKTNKTIVVWPAEGEGVVVGMIRRGIGKSHAGYESGYEYPEWNPGYFVAREWHWLYLVKCNLQQKDPIYVPLWACTPIAS